MAAISTITFSREDHTNRLQDAMRGFNANSDAYIRHIDGAEEATVKSLKEMFDLATEYLRAMENDQRNCKKEIFVAIPIRLYKQLSDHKMNTSSKIRDQLIITGEVFLRVLNMEMNIQKRKIYASTKTEFYSSLNSIKYDLDVQSEIYQSYLNSIKIINELKSS